MLRRVARAGNQAQWWNAGNLRRVPDVQLAPDTSDLMTFVVAYVLIGLLFAIPFAWRWSARLDPVAAKGTIGFRLLVIPGAVLLWPWLTAKLLRGRTSR